MKGHIMSLPDKILLRKRTLIETINDELKNHRQFEYTRRRFVDGLLFNIIRGLTAYRFFSRKRCLNLDRFYDNQFILLPA